MRFLANENFPASSFSVLQNNKWDIEHIGETNMGITDEEVIELSIQENRIIITFDSDYGELVFKHGYQPKGVNYLRIKKFTPEYPTQLLTELIEEERLEVEGKFTVINDNQIRQREI